MTGDPQSPSERSDTAASERNTEPQEQGRHRGIFAEFGSKIAQLLKIFEPHQDIVLVTALLGGTASLIVHSGVAGKFIKVFSTLTQILLGLLSIDTILRRRTREEREPP